MAISLKNQKAETWHEVSEKGALHKLYKSSVGGLNGIYGIKSPFSGAYGISNGVYGNIDYFHIRLPSF